MPVEYINKQNVKDRMKFNLPSLISYFHQKLSSLVLFFQRDTSTHAGMTIYGETILIHLSIVHII